MKTKINPQQFLFIILILSSMSARSQVKIDSLWNVWEDPSRPDTVRMFAMKDLIEKGYLFSKPDTAFILGQTLFDLADSLGFENWKATALNYQGISCAIRGRYDQAIERFTYCLLSNELIGNKHRIASSLNNIAQVYQSIDEDEKALEYFKKSRIIYVEIDDHYGLGLAFANSATLENSLGLYSDAIESAKKAEEYCIEVGNKQLIANLYHELGIGYEGLSKMKSETASRASLQQLALDYFKKCLALREENGDRSGKALTLITYASLIHTMGNTQQAIALTEEALQIANDVGAKTEIGLAAGQLSDLYREIKNYSTALSMKDIEVAMLDSVRSEQNEREILRQEYKYNYDKQALADSLNFAKKEAIKDLEIEKRDANIAKQRWALAGTTGIIALLFALAISIRRSKKRSDELLHNILPEEVAKEIKLKGKAESRRIDNVTVIFTDFKGFTAISENLTPKELVEDLDTCFSEFDRIIEKYGIEKIKTIGDAYMAAGGIPLADRMHAQKVTLAAIEMRDFVNRNKEEKIKNNLPYFEIRIGIHTGPVVAGIVGVKKFQYDIWGDTVNTASRMESSGEVGKINISQSTYELLKDTTIDDTGNPQFEFENRGKIEVKGKGEIYMYFVSKA